LLDGGGLKLGTANELAFTPQLLLSLVCFAGLLCLARRLSLLPRVHPLLCFPRLM
jgi:hypothetical protein